MEEREKKEELRKEGRKRVGKEGGGKKGKVQTISCIAEGIGVCAGGGVDPASRELAQDSTEIAGKATIGALNPAAPCGYSHSPSQKFPSVQLRQPHRRLEYRPRPLCWQIAAQRRQSAASATPLPGRAASAPGRVCAPRFCAPDSPPRPWRRLT